MLGSGSEARQVWKRLGSVQLGIPRKSQCRSKAVHLDQVSRRNSGKSRPCETSGRVTTL